MEIGLHKISDALFGEEIVVEDYLSYKLTCFALVEHNGECHKVTKISR